MIDTKTIENKLENEKGESNEANGIKKPPQFIIQPPVLSIDAGAEYVQNAYLKDGKLVVIARDSAVAIKAVYDSGVYRITADRDPDMIGNDSLTEHTYKIEELEHTTGKKRTPDGQNKKRYVPIGVSNATETLKKTEKDTAYASHEATQSNTSTEVPGDMTDKARNETFTFNDIQNTVDKVLGSYTLDKVLKDVEFKMEQDRLERAATGKIFATERQNAVERTRANAYAERNGYARHAELSHLTAQLSGAQDITGVTATHGLYKN